MSGSCQNGVYPAIEKPTRFSDKNGAILNGLRVTFSDKWRVYFRAW
jgi:hypothetical protein